MICHDNIIYNAAIVVKYIGLEEDKEVIVSYLPLSHVAAQVIDIFTGLYVRAQCFFADRNALKGSLIETLREVQPTRFLGVPRVWEKIQEKMLQVGANNGYLKKMIANWAKAQGLQHNLNNMEGYVSDFGLNAWRIVRYFFFVSIGVQHILGVIQLLMH